MYFLHSTRRRHKKQHRAGTPWLLKYRSSKFFIVFTVSLAVFTDIFLYAVIVPVIPFSLHERANIPTSQVQSWVSILVAVYGGALAAFSPVVGWAADRSPNRRLPLVLGLLALGASTILLNLGSSIAILCLGRVLQGISAAVVWVVGLALVADTVGAEDVATVLGYVFVGLSLGFLVGPLLGGVVFARAGFNAVFGMAYALIGVDIGLRLLMIEKKVAGKYRVEETELRVSEEGKCKSKDEDPVVLGGVPLDEAGEPRKDSDDIGIQQVMNAAQRPGNTTANSPEDAVDTPNPPTSSEPMPVTKRRVTLPPVITLLKSRRLLSALWATWVMAAIMTQFDSVLPLHVQRAFHWSSTGAGLIFIPVVIPSFIGPVFGYVIDRYGPRFPAALGFLLLTPAEVLLRFVTHDTLRQKVLLCALLALIGLALSAVVTATMAEITYIVTAKEAQRPGLFGAKGAYAQAYGLFNGAWAVGCLIGPIWAGEVSDAAGWGTMTWSIALLAGVTAVPVFVWTGGALWKRDGRTRRGGEEGVV